LDIAHSKYHRHSAYLLQHADMPGFPREEQLLLSALVGGHRRQLSFESLEDLLPPWDRHAEFLIVLLRLAVLLHRGRSPQPLPDVVLRVKGRTLTLELPPRWMKEHPLDPRGSRTRARLLEGSRFPPQHRVGRVRCALGAAGGAF
jgi:exopolyphosphatase/guanosine-5'-triphosphate,3'-diphosphate pyrophosphatase